MTLRMTSDEITTVAARVIGRDKRQIGESEAVDWIDAAEDGSWTYPAAMRAVRVLLRDTDRKYLTPALVDREIRKIRGLAAATFREPDMPDGMTNGAYLELCRRARTAHVDRALAGWAATGHEPAQLERLTTASRAALTSRQAPPAVRDQIRAGLQRLGLEPHA